MRLVSLFLLILSPLLFLGLNSIAATGILPETGNLLERVPSPTEALQKIQQNVDAQISRTSMGYNFNLVNLQLLPQVQAGFSYRYANEPSYMGGYYSRTDSYRMNVNVSPMSFFPPIAVPLGVGISSGTDVTFVRQFKSQTEAGLAIPYSVANLPVTAKIAKERLKPGDFASFTANMNLVLSLSQAAPLGIPISPTATGFVNASGNFLVHFFRMKDNKVRVRLIAQKSKGAGITGALSSTIPGVDLNIISFGPAKDIANGQVNSFLHSTPIDLSSVKTDTDSFVIDYIFNLNDPKAQGEYNKLFSKGYRWRPELKFVTKDSPESLKKSMMSDLTGIEKLYQADKALPSAQRRVDRVFEGFSNTVSQTNGVHAGLNILGIGLFDARASEVHSKTDLTSIAWDEKQQRYQYESYSPRTNFSAFFGKFRSEDTAEVGAIHEVPIKTPEKKRLKAFVLSHDLSQHSFNEYQRDQERQKLGFILSKEMVKGLPDWDIGADQSKIYTDSRASSRLYVQREALDRVGPKTPEQLKRFFLQEFKNDKIPASLHIHNRLQPRETDTSTVVCYEKLSCYDEDLTAICKHLSRVIDAKEADENRFNAFRSLMKIPFFKDIGDGFITRLIPDGKKSKDLRYEYSIAGGGMQPYTIKYGIDPKDELYHSVKYVESVLNNRSIDMRVFKEGKDDRFAPAAANASDVRVEWADPPKVTPAK